MRFCLNLVKSKLGGAVPPIFNLGSIRCSGVLCGDGRQPIRVISQSCCLSALCLAAGARASSLSSEDDSQLSSLCPKNEILKGASSSD